MLMNVNELNPTVYKKIKDRILVEERKYSSGLTSELATRQKIKAIIEEEAMSRY